MKATFTEQISGRRWSRLARQVWQREDGARQSGSEIAQELLSLGIYAFPVETVERSSVGVIVRAAGGSWERIE